MFRPSYVQGTLRCGMKKRSERSKLTSCAQLFGGHSILSTKPNSSTMFRPPPHQLMRVVRVSPSTLAIPSSLPKISKRFASTRLKSGAVRQGTRPFWTTGRALLFSAFASTLGYGYGVYDTGSFINDLWKKQSGPDYGGPVELSKVCWSQYFQVSMLNL